MAFSSEMSFIEWWCKVAVVVIPILIGLLGQGLSESVAENINDKPNTLGISHWRVLVWLDQTGLPSWQIGISMFLLLSIFGLTSLILSSADNPSVYINSVAFVAIVTFFMVLYLELGRGWHHDFLEILEFDRALFSVKQILKPSPKTLRLEVAFAFLCATVNLYFSKEIEARLEFIFFAIYALYWLQYIFVMFFLDIFFRQLRCLMEICEKIRVSLLEADVYAVLANPMLRFLRLYISGLCIVFASYTIFTAGTLSLGSMLIVVMPFYLPGLFMLGLFMVPYNRIKQRIHVAKTIELNHVHRALVNGDKAHLHSSLIGEDADKLTRVDLMYYQDRIEKIKELPFTDRIRGMLIFGVLPPLTWVIAALIEIFIEGVI